MTTLTIEDVKNKIRAVENFPKEGIIFRDVTSILEDADGLHLAIDLIQEKLMSMRHRRKHPGEPQMRIRSMNKKLIWT